MTCKSYMTVDSVLTRLTKKFEEKAKEGEEHVHQQILFRCVFDSFVGGVQKEHSRLTFT